MSWANEYWAPVSDFNLHTSQLITSINLRELRAYEPTGNNILHDIEKPHRLWNDSLEGSQKKRLGGLLLVTSNVFLIPHVIYYCPYHQSIPKLKDWKITSSIIAFAGIVTIETPAMPLCTSTTYLIDISTIYITIWLKSPSHSSCFST